MNDEARFERLLLLFLFVVVAACGRAEVADTGDRPGDAETGQVAFGTGRDDSPLTVYAVSYPMSYLAERVGGDHVTVVLPRILAQGDPAYAQPDAETVAEFQSADLIIRNGAGYAQWMETATLPETRIVDTAAGFSDRFIRIENALTHSHGPEGEHSHDRTATNTWLDPQLAIAQAEAIAEAFSSRRPGDAGDFDDNLASLRADLTELDAALAAGTAALRGAPLLASYPIYQYFARRYELDLRAVQLQSWVEPTSDEWNELAALHAEHQSRWMIWESQPVDAIVARLDEMGIRALVIDPCATPPEEGDYLSVMRDNADRLISTTGAR